MLVVQILRKIKISFYVLIIVVVYALMYGINLKKYQRGEIIQHDVISYYAYWPAVLIYHDLSFGFVSNLPENSSVTVWTQTSPSGMPTLKMTMGVAVMTTPFFIMAHLLSDIFGFESNGYSAIYQIFLLFAAIFYLFAGLFFLRKTLLQFFSEMATSLVLAIIVLATNLFYYTSVEPGMSHVFSFFLFAWGLWLMNRWFETPGWQYSVFLGLAAGLIILVRPSNGVVFLVPVLFSMGRIKSIQWKYLPLILLVMFLILIPQLAYWKFSTGKWIYYAYGDERFYFSDPKIMQGLIGYRKGWLVYTPVMVLALLGFFFMRDKIRDFQIPILIYFVVNLYVVFSWWCWWYGGGFGARPLIESYVFLALPLAVSIKRVLSSRRVIKYLTMAVLVFLVYLNLFQIRQYRTTLLHWDSTSRELYWEVFLSHHWPENYDALLDPPDYKAAQFRQE